MKILLGFITGLAISGTLTYQYGGDWAKRIHREQLLPIVAMAKSVEADIPGPASVSPQAVPEEFTPVVAAMTAARPAIESPERAQNAVASAAGNETEAAWAGFMSNSDQLSASGEFPWRACFTRSAASYEVPELLLLAVARGESAFDATARSHRDAVGVMQIRWPQTAAHLGILSERQLYEPCINIDAGARYLRELLDRYSGNAHLALAAYNFGPGRVSAEHVPQLAGKYSGYILQQLHAVLGKQTRPVQASPATGEMLLLDFTQAHRALAMQAFLLESEPALRLSIAASPRGTHGVYLAYADEAEQQRALRAINATGITIAMVGASRHNQEGLAHDF